MHTQMLVERVVAIIFIPGALSLESAYAQNCINYVLRRGYRLAGLARDWSEIDTELRTGRAGLVVVAHGEHAGYRLEELTTAERTQPVRRPGAASARCRVNEAPIVREVAAWRGGYREGFVDCLTIAGSSPN